MTNPDTNTLNGALTQLGETMANNLISMGITDATPSDGLTTLSHRILDIEPSIGGLDLDTAVTLSANSSTIYQGQSLILTSKLTASYDDETLVDVDLKGVLQNATVYFKEGNTLIGTGITDTDGIATATINDLNIGSHTIKAIFEGTDNFKSCESTTLTITVSTLNLDHITLVSDKSILSHADGESAILTATLKDSNDSTISVDNINIDIYKDNTKISTLQTVNGVASYTYNSQGVGDVVFYAKVSGILSSEIYVVDAKYYDASSSNNISKYTKNGNGTITYDATNNAYLLNNGTSNWKMYSFSLDSFNIPNHAVLKAKVKLISSFNCQCGLGLVNGNNGLSGKICVSTDSSAYTMSVIEPTKTTYGTNEVYTYLTSSTMQSNVWYDLEITYEGNTITLKLYNGTTLIGTATTTSTVLDSTNNNLAFWIGMYANSQANIKDIFVL